MDSRTQAITPVTVLRVLVAGFLLVVLALAAAGIISVESIRSIRTSVAQIVAQELVTIRLLDDIQHEQAALSIVFNKLSHDPQQVDREKILADLDDADDRLEEIGDSVKGSSEEPLWKELKQASQDFSSEARRLLSLEEPSTLLSRDLFRMHSQALSVAAKVAASSYAKASAARGQVDRRSDELIRNSALLLGACVLLALVCASLTVWMAVSLLRRMELQATELGRVSWHMLENQETAARRFSHELHDELGQALTAIKANLAALQNNRSDGANRIADTIELVDSAMQNVRQMSQLLHPTILDDFGLDAAVRWLAEGFEQRTGIEVQYESTLCDRLPLETETHLFRICQESLTNVAKHSGATRVRIDLREEPGRVRLSIADNGHGLQVQPAAGRAGLGLIAMRARAHSAGGTLVYRSPAGGGFTVEVEAPRRPVEEPAPHHYAHQ